MSTQQENLRAIADAIREKESGAGAIPASQFAGRIRALPTGGGAVEKVKLTNTYGYIEGDLSYYDPAPQYKALDSLMGADAFKADLTERMQFTGGQYTVSAVWLEGDTLNIELRGFSS